MNPPKIHPKYRVLYGSNKRYYLISGGRGSSKSFSVADFILKLTYQKGHVILFTRYTLTSAHISIIPEFLEKMELYGNSEHFDITKDSIENKLTGSKILFKGIRTSSGNQTANLKSIQGVTTWVLDEAEELTDEKTFDKIDDSIRAKNLQNRVILILNPTTFDHWIYQRFENQRRHDVEYIHTTYLDNIQNLSESFLEKIELCKVTSPNKYNHVYLGKWLEKMDGVVFENWEIGDFDETLPLQCFGQDYGFSNDPSTLVRVGIDNKAKILYLHEGFVLKGLGTGKIQELNATIAGKQTIVGDRAELRLIKELRDSGLKMVECVKGKGSVASSLKLMQDYRIIVTKDSVNLQKELRNYVWLANDIPIDDYNHCIDAARYAFDFLTTKNTGQYNIA